MPVPLPFPSVVKNGAILRTLVLFVNLRTLADRVGVPDGGRQQIVEIMRDTARQTPDCFHLLRLPELLLAVVQYAARLPVAQRIADRSLEVRADEMFLDVV